LILNKNNGVLKWNLALTENISNCGYAANVDFGDKYNSI